ncbi:MAG: dehydrogenase/CO-methylating acetyl-CoA synthase complex, beta subunit [Methanomicrobiales archaeon]|nr:dehydrogenase/CO-methylating acetyl-CoA synthase complex, beta subunit [Methanomicrobiales archaeon]
MEMFSDIPVEVGLVHEGERIRRKEMQVELGGPAIPDKFELVRVREMDRVEQGKVSVEGPDLSEMEEGKAYPLGTSTATTSKGSCT